MFKKFKKNNEKKRRSTARASGRIINNGRPENINPEQMHLYSDVLKELRAKQNSLERQETVEVNTTSGELDEEGQRKRIEPKKPLQQTAIIRETQKYGKYRSEGEPEYILGKQGNNKCAYKSDDEVKNITEQEDIDNELQNKEQQQQLQLNSQLPQKTEVPDSSTLQLGNTSTTSSPSPPPPPPSPPPRQQHQQQQQKDKKKNILRTIISFFKKTPINESYNKTNNKTETKITVELNHSNKNPTDIEKMLSKSIITNVNEEPSTSKKYIKKCGKSSNSSESLNSFKMEHNKIIKPFHEEYGYMSVRKLKLPSYYGANTGKLNTLGNKKAQALTQALTQE